MSERSGPASDSPLPLDEVETPALSVWSARLGEGWDTWMHPEDPVKIHAEMIDLEVPPDTVTYGWELRLEIFPGGDRPPETRVRETVHNPYLALRTAEELARNAQRYVDAWEEGLAPRPADVGPIKHDGA